MGSRRRSAADQDDWQRKTYYIEEASTSRSTPYAVLTLLLLAVIVLCTVGFFAVRVLFSSSTPVPLPASVAQTGLPPTSGSDLQSTSTVSAPGTVKLAINPQQGYVNTLVTVTGQGWWPGEPVFVFLRSQDEGEGPGYAYAAAVADDRGNVHTAFTFPNEMRWIGEELADVIARGTRSGMEAATRFTLVIPTPTSTAPLPTARPTLATTDTPWPTDTPSLVPTPTPDIIITDWRGEYYANPALSGEPVYIRNDVKIDFNWGGGSPDPRIPVDRFSARWSRQQFFSQGLYRFSILPDDGVRFWIDGQLYVDEWHDSVLLPYSFDLYMPQGHHSLWLEYYENLGGAMVQVTWSAIEPPTATATLTPVPTDTPLPTAKPTNTPTSTPVPTTTPTPTATFTSTPTSEPTATPTPTPSSTDTPSPTPEPTAASSSFQLSTASMRADCVWAGFASVPRHVIIWCHEEGTG
jgi:hypothetical protein